MVKNVVQTPETKVMRYEYPSSYRTTVIDAASVNSVADTSGVTLQVNLNRISSRILSETYISSPSGQLTIGGLDTAFETELVRSVEMTALMRPTAALNVISALVRQIVTLPTQTTDALFPPEVMEAIREFDSKLTGAVVK